MKIYIVPILQDNYSYVLEANGEAAVIDPGEAEPIIDFLDKNELKLTHILCTHHHWDHTDGNEELQQRYGVRIVGPDDDLSDRASNHFADDLRGFARWSSVLNA